MNLSKEHVLALKITGVLLVFAFLITFGFQYINQDEVLRISKGHNSNNRYFVLFIIAILSYVISYILAKITIKPIEDNNIKLKEYNHNLAHEIKTPLAVLKGNIELLELGFDKDLLKSSKEEIDGMESIIDSLLFLSENNELKNIEKVDIGYLLKKYTTNSIIIKGNTKFIINGNSNLIERLLKNVVENAVKYNKVGEKIIIKLTKHSFSISNMVSGKLDGNNLNKLFNTFHQDDNSRSTSGYGLGLSIVKKICDIHNINVNIVYKNSFFTLTVK